ncbi:NtaA/DmoA family FMN-dependent monooxygenase [Bartonella choladocola]|uniref:FMN-dependent oxidoreductase, nitrilotriacetate monooxygenase family n=1 Tax=Bartonella choladocola TaxID=2750995 RepID=A0A1U9MGT6_9HYPH|nr:NtaA/DmoA family FMN-dependent monooxygenase [Bartonella choladocola]AQT46892.1 FMN-dependent oxidoreductase, nitrilotriacetate monooxygenase family [Bartonella choladocola]
MRRMYLNAMVFGLGSHMASWRLPDVDPLAITRLSYWTDIAKRAEKGQFDSLFLGDILALQHEVQYSVSGALDTVVVLSALAAITDKIGLIGTASTTFDHPYHIARRFASLDHISNGRVGWNVVTSTTLSEAKNFGRDVIAPSQERYARAEDVLNAVMALWESWQPGARIANKKTGLYLNPSAVRGANYTGSYTRSIGPLSVPRSPQVKPILAQGGASDIGRSFAARYADLAFTAQPNLNGAQQFYKDIKQRAKEFGRNNEDVLVFPGIVPVIGKTHKEAEAKFNYLNSFAIPQSGIQRLSYIFDRDLSEYSLDKPLPETLLKMADDPKTPSRTRIILGDARLRKLTLKQMIGRFMCSRGHLLLVGTAEEVADTMQYWFENGAADGFNVLFPSLPNDIDIFAESVIPLLESRGLHIKPEEGELLRKRYQLPFHENETSHPVAPRHYIAMEASNTHH